MFQAPGSSGNEVSIGTLECSEEIDQGQESSAQNRTND